MKIPKQNESLKETSQPETFHLDQDNKNSNTKKIDITKKIICNNGHKVNKEPDNLSDMEIEISTDPCINLNSYKHYSTTEIDEGYISDRCLSDDPKQSKTDSSPFSTTLQASAPPPTLSDRTEDDELFQSILKGATDFLNKQKNQSKTENSLQALVRLNHENISKTEQTHEIMAILTHTAPTLTSRLLRKSSRNKSNLENDIIVFLKNNHGYELKHLFCQKLCNLDIYLQQKNEAVEATNNVSLSYLKQLLMEDPQLIKTLLNAPRLLKFVLSDCTTQQLNHYTDLICDTNDSLNPYGDPQTELKNYENLTDDQIVSSMCEFIKAFVWAYQKEHNTMDKKSSITPQKIAISKDEVLQIVSKSSTIFNHMPSGPQQLALLLNKIIDEDILNLDLNSLDMISQMFLTESLSYIFTENNGTVAEQVQILDSQRKSLRHKPTLSAILGEYNPSKESESIETKACILIGEQLYDAMLTQSTAKSHITFKTYLNFLIQSDQLNKSQSVKLKELLSNKQTPADHGMIDTTSDVFRGQLKELTSDKLKYLENNKKETIKNITDNIQKNLQESNCDNITEVIMLQFYTNLLETTLD